MWPRVGAPEDPTAGEPVVDLGSIFIALFEY